MATTRTNPYARTTLDEALIVYRQPTGEDARLRQMQRLHVVERNASIPIQKA